MFFFMRRLNKKPVVFNSYSLKRFVFHKYLPVSVMRSTVDASGNNFMHAVLKAPFRPHHGQIPYSLQLLERLARWDSQQLELFDLEATNKEGESVFELMQQKIKLALTLLYPRTGHELMHLKQFAEKYRVKQMGLIETVLEQYIIRDVTQIVLQVSKNTYTHK